MLIQTAILLGVASGALGGLTGLLVSKALGLYGRDAFKPWRRELVPESCGFGLAVALAASLSTLYALSGDVKLLAASLVTLLNAVIGLVDDIYRMDPVTKPIATMVSASILVALDALPDKVFIPLYGWAHTRILYALAAPLLIGVSANALNMIDVLNGVMPTLVALVTVTLIAAHFIMVHAGLVNLDHGAVSAAALLVTASLVYLLLYNRYPARCFNGDSGSLALGALMGYTAAILHQELVYIIAAAPLVLNGFQILAYTRRFMERREIPRPTVVDEHGFIHGVCSDAPPTLLQLLTLTTPLNELEAYIAITIVALASCLFALASAALVYLVLPPW